MEEALKALAEPRRRRILELVRDEELTAGAIAAQFEVSRPAVSQHLQVLEGAGLVNVRRDGTRRLYRARPEGLEDLKEFLEGFWGSGLLRLKHAVERDERRRTRSRTSQEKRRG
jgi:DNA-binding transcriptional ArsR family regulator